MVVVWWVFVDCFYLAMPSAVVASAPVHPLEP